MARSRRLQLLGRRCYDVMPAAVNIAVILFVVVQLLNVDGRVDAVEQRLDEVERRLAAVEAGVAGNRRRLEEVLDRLP
jgi:uncharacterized protein YoxC